MPLGVADPQRNMLAWLNNNHWFRNSYYGVPDVVTAPGRGGGPHVRLFRGTTAAELGSFFAYDPAVLNGVFVG